MIEVKEIKQAIKTIDSNVSIEEKDNYLFEKFGRTNFNVLKKYYKNFYELSNMIGRIEDWYSKAEDRFLHITINTNDNEKHNRLYNKYNTLNKKYRTKNTDFVRKIHALEKIGSTFASTTNDLILADKLKKYYSSPYKLHSAYNNMVKYGQDDDRLDSVRQYFPYIESYVNKYEELIANGVIDEVNQHIKEQNKIQNEIDYDLYTEYIVQEYINSSEYWLYRFVNTYGLTEEFFSECIEHVKNINYPLWEDFNHAYLVKETRRIQAVKSTFDSISDAIDHGKYSDGAISDKLEYLKRTPIKSHNIFNNTLAFTKNHNSPDVQQTIQNYMMQNQIYDYSFRRINIEDMKLYGYQINGRKLRANDIDIIIHYMAQRNVPLYKTTFREAAEMYIQGLINPNNVNMNIPIRHQNGKIITPILKRNR